MRNKVFISHATPDDDDFSRWLSLKLIGLGYEVWCDILLLDLIKKNNIQKKEVTSTDVARLILVVLGPVFGKTTGAQVPIDG